MRRTTEKQANELLYASVQRAPVQARDYRVARGMSVYRIVGIVISASILLGVTLRHAL